MSLRLLPRLRLAARPSVPVRRAAAAVPAARALSASAVARAQAGAREADDERVDADPYELVDSHRRMGADGREPNDPQLGDYPELPFASLQRRRYDPSWWDAQEKRNFGETLHEQDDVLGVWAPDVHDVPPASAARQFGLAGLIAAAFAGVVYMSVPDRPAVLRSYPRGGLAQELGSELVAARDEAASEGGEEEDDE